MNRSKLLIASLTLLTFVGCDKSSTGFSLLADSQSFSQSSAVKLNNQIDILWVVDNSGSMDPYQQNLVNNFNSFISNFVSKGYDFHMAVTTSDAYLAAASQRNTPAYAKFRDGTNATSHTGVFTILPTTPNLTNTFVVNATQGSGGSGDERAFSSFKEALNSSLNTGFLRPNSFLAVIILSDEDDFSGNGRAEMAGVDHSYSAGTLDTVSSYVSYLDTLTGSTPSKRRYNVSAISVVDNACLQAHQAGGSIMGTRYIQIANQTNGVLGSICDSSYANSLNFIQQKIAELSSEFYLSRVPDPATISVKVNGVSVPQDATNGWTYDSVANGVIFHGTSVPAQGADIQIAFQPTQVKT